MDADPNSGMNRVLIGNIRELLEKRRSEQRRAGPQQRVADAITGFAGSMACVYFHAAIFGAWAAINFGWTGLPRFDPSFVLLATLASVEAIFLSTFVLISQNRLSAQAEKRADLDLQISLLAEHEITRLLQMMRAVTRHFEIAVGDEGELSELERDVAPGNVLDTIERESDSPHPGPGRSPNP